MKTLIKIYEGEKRNGKNVLILTGIHGDEITPIYTIASMIKDNNFNLKYINKLTILNGVNISGIKKANREMIENKTKDLNRILTNTSEEDAIKLLKDKISENDIIIDIHSSPSCTEFVLIDIDEYTNTIKSWCDKSDVKYGFRYSGANTIKRYCLEQEKPALTLEINKMKIIDFESAEKTTYLINNLLKNIDFRLYESIPNVKEMIEIKTYQEGLLEHHYFNGENFHNGDILYTLFDFELNEIFKMIAKFDGYILCEPDNSFVNRGDIIYAVQPI